MHDQESVNVQLYSKLSHLLNIGKSSYRPPPLVKSCLIELQPLNPLLSSMVSLESALITEISEHMLKSNLNPRKSQSPNLASKSWIFHSSLLVSFEEIKSKEM
ncbi:hypothetical protein MJO28_009892 [Puccinia striiformis f. sp. tritici]|uniref:Uncharacterized protein n=1 Tax=Puccinia striiformis f. sp. tritici TaxID=168172 RepID=A0ACC0E8I4_9BASI|nr:hypothetical protein MJO28_009892 [Puccinia striiformis f. sp. tritici]